MDNRVGTLSRWSANLAFETLSPAVVPALKRAVRDALGCALFGSTLPWSKVVLDTLVDEEGGAGRIQVWGTAERLTPAAAALVNGAFVQSFELDDLHYSSHLHGSSAMLPAALALAEHRGTISGRDLLTALAVGWEIGARMGRCLGTHALVRGWHTPTINGTFAAAAAAGRLIGLDEERMFHCLGLAGLQASGLLAVQYGGMAKRLYAGRAAQTGIYCALLAERGYTAPPDVFECTPGGFFPTFAGPQGSYEIGELTKTLGVRYEAEDINFKLYPACAAIHTALDVTSDLRQRHPFDPEEVTELTVSVSEVTYHHVGWPYVPQSVTTAQFSLAYSLAVLLLEGAAFVDQYRPELLADPRVLDLVDRVKVIEDPELTRLGAPARNAARVSLHLKDGTLLEGYEELARGNVHNPASETELRGKFEQLAGRSFPPARVEELARQIDDLERVEEVSVLADLLAVTSPDEVGARQTVS